MNRDREVSRSFKTARQLLQGAAAALVTMACVQSAFAQGGQTEVAKTTPSNPPPAVAAPVPVPVAPLQAAPAKPANPAADTSAAWHTDVASPPQVPAETDSQIVAKVNEYFNKLTDLQGVFIQTDPDNRQKQGRFYFQRPGKVRFDYGGSSLKIISDGTTLAIEDKDANTSERYPLESTPFRLLLSENVDLAKEAKILSVEQGSDVFILTVEDKKGGSGRIRLFFNKADMSLNQWIVTDAQGLDTRIEVSNLQQNKQVSSNIFEFSKMVGFGFSNAN